MKRRNSKNNTGSRSPQEKLPLHMRRTIIMCQRACAVFSNVRLREESGPLLTRTCYSNHIERVLGAAAYKFCRYLYAQANGPRSEAVRCWEEVTGAVEYELPMALLHPVKDLKRRRSREHAVDKVMLIIRAEMAMNKKSTEKYYAKFGHPSNKKSKWCVQFHLKKPLVRPAESCFEEFFQWAASMVAETFGTAEMIRTTFMQKKP